MSLFYFTITLLVLSAFIASYIVQTKNFFGSAGQFLILATAKLSTFPDFDKEVSDLQTVDIPAAKEHFLYLHSYEYTMGLVVVWNLVVCGFAYFDVYNWAIYVIHLLTSILNSTMIMNFLRIRNWKWEIDGVCRGYSILIQSAEYIHEEEEGTQDS